MAEETPAETGTGANGAGATGSEAGKDGPAAAPGQQQAHMRILAQYIRDLSFENAMMQKGIQGTQLQPDIQVAVNLDARKRQAENQYEVLTKFRVTSRNKADQATLFLLELEYGTVVQLEGVPPEQVPPFLLIETPRLVFPFIRRIVSDVTHDGGFPPLNIDNVDFVALYRQEMARRQAAQKTQEEPGTPPDTET